MTPITYSLRSGVAAAGSRVTPAAASGAIALVAGASLFVATNHYPAVLEIGSAVVRVQDVLFGILVVLSAPALVRWGRAHPAIGAGLIALATLLLVSAARSPAGSSAVVAIAKYVEFVLAGMAMGIAIRASRTPASITGLFALGCTAIAIGAFGDLLVHDGLTGIWRARSGGPLTMESAAALAGAATVWFAVRLTRLESQTERGLAILGLAAAAAVLVLAKSVLLVGCLAALVALAPVLRSPWYRRAAVVCAVLAVVAMAGRWGDITEATRGAAADQPGFVLPPEGGPSRLPLGYPQRAPAHVTGGSFVHRTALAYMGIETAADAPFLGHGWLATSDARFLRAGPYDRYMAERFPRLAPALFVSNYPTASHNGYIQTVAEAGVLAGVVLVGILLAAALPAVATIWRRRTVAPWRQATGFGWLVITAVFLLSSTLYGGQFETVLLGAAVVVAVGDQSVRLRARAWAAGVLVVGLLGALFVAAVTLPAGAASTTSLVRVTAVERTTGAEVVREGARLADARDVELRNGLVTVRVASGGIEIAPGPDGPAMDPLVIGAALPREMHGFLYRRMAESIVLLLVDRSGRRLASITMVRGVPGAYVGVSAPRRRLSVGRVDRVATGRALERSLGVPGGAADSLAALTPLAAVTSAGPDVVGLPLNDALVSLRAQRLTLEFLGSDSVAFVGPIPAATQPGSPGGAYLSIPRDRSTGTRVIRSERPGRGLLPLMLDDDRRSGAAESASLAFTYRAAPPQ